MNGSDGLEVFCDLNGYVISNCPSQDVCDSINMFIINLLEYKRGIKAVAKALQEATECPLAQTFCLVEKIISAEKDKEPLILMVNNLFMSIETTPREEMLFRAITSWAEGNIDISIDLHKKISKDYPKDLVNLFLGFNHFVYVYNVDNLIAFLNMSIKEMSENPYFCAMMCFALGENEEFQYASDVGMKGLALKPGNPWTHHSLSHVFQDLGQEDEGIRFMEKNFHHWNDCIPFMKSHNWWHLVMFYLKKFSPDSEEMKKVQAYIDEHIWPYGKAKSSAEFCRDPTVTAGIIGLLWKMEMQGFMQGHSVIQKDWFMSKWTTIIPIVREKVSFHIFPFFDIHFVFALTHVMDQNEVLEYAKQIEDHGSQWKKNFSVQAWKDVLPPLTKGVISFCYGDMNAAFHYFHKIRDHICTIGGSNAQRDPITETYIRSCMASGHYKIAYDWITTSETAKKHKGVCQYPELLQEILEKLEDDDTVKSQK